MRHDQSADHAGRRSPRGGPRGLLRAGVVEELDAEGAGEVLAELVARGHLQRLAVAHHPFERQRVDGPAKRSCGLHADDHGIASTFTMKSS